MQISTFMIADETFAIPSLVVEEYFRPLPVTRVPGSDPRIDGLVNIRGRTGVVVNMRCCLGLEPRPVHQCGEMILLETTQRLVAEARDLKLTTFEESVVLNVDSASHIYHLIDEEKHPSPPHVNQLFVDGVVCIDEHYFTMLSVSKLIQHLLHGTIKDLP
ncbi:MAG: chemotaxis protein CheW [Pirellulaceae bacterium]|nr:chemotaxis protein CheW [Pirellulaceae bacterium]